MFATIKAKLYAFAAIIFAAMGIAIKFLLMRNKSLKEENAKHEKLDEIQEEESKAQTQSEEIKKERLKKNTGDDWKDTI